MWPEFKLFSLVFLLVISCYILRFALRAEEPHEQGWCWARWDCSAWRPPEAPWDRYSWTVVQAAEHPKRKGATNGEDASSLPHQPRARLGLGPHHLPFWPSEGLPECHRFPWFLWWEDSAGLVVLIISLRSPSSYSWKLVWRQDPPRASPENIRTSEFFLIRN